MPCHALPFYHLQIQAKRPPHPHRWKRTQITPEHPETLGEHLKQHRLKLHLMQAEVAEKLGVHVESLKNWERGVGVPALLQVGAIIRFLGYDPEPEPKTMPERIVYLRRRLGLTQKKLAKALATDAVTLYRWEKGTLKPPLDRLQRLEHLYSARPMILTRARLRRLPSNSP
jgi:DNA-binding transcriptional regulator YiaG